MSESATAPTATQHVNEPAPASSTNSEALTPFGELPLSEPIQQALAERNYVNATPIQAAMIPHVMAGNDVLGQAQTGTGKTAAFALPLLAHASIPISASRRFWSSPPRVNWPVRSPMPATPTANICHRCRLPLFMAALAIAINCTPTPRCRYRCRYARSHHGSHRKRHPGPERITLFGA